MQVKLEQLESVIIGKVAEAANQLQLPAFVVGGFVRDKLLGRPCKDIDVVCLGDAITLANAVSEKFQPQPKVSWFKNFGTAHLNIQGYDVEFVGARKESYQQHSRNPTVVPGTIKDDQERRDFTINALAIDLQEALSDQIKLVDPFNGVQDLEDKIIRTPLSPDKTLSMTVELTPHQGVDELLAVTLLFSSLHEGFD
jgi:tRNA nucleotidyltransferase/poly(A) polymerase